MKSQNVFKKFEEILPKLEEFWRFFTEREQKFIREMWKNSENFKHKPNIIIESFHIPGQEPEITTSADFWNYQMELFLKTFEENFGKQIDLNKNPNNSHSISDFMKYFFGKNGKNYFYFTTYSGKCFAKSRTNHQSYSLGFFF